jgi:osmoprotectant transport system ATP-binding protein
MDTTAKPMIRLEQVVKRYDDGTQAVADLDLEVTEGEVTVLVGPSGCGKTTTMRMINRLIDSTSGNIFVDGKNVVDVDPVELRRHIGYVIQAVGLFPHKTIRKNVGTVGRLLGWNRSELVEKSNQMLSLVDLDPEVYGDRYPHQLSGGQRQRVGVARALLTGPPVLLMDEPFGAVDPIARDRLQEQFLSLQQKLGTTTVIVTHDIDEAVRLGDRIAVMKQGGHLEQYAPPAEVLGHPANDFVAQFVGSDRLLKLMAVVDVEDTVLNKVTASDSTLPQVPADATLRAATLALMASKDGRVLVVDSSDAPVGTLTLDGVRQILTNQRDVAASNGPGVDPVSGQVASG